MSVLLLSILMPLALSIEFTITIPANKVRCFYEHLDYQSKYNVEFRPMNIASYQFFVQTVESDQIIYSKTTTQSLDPTVISKFAPQANYYGFCVKNLVSTPMDSIFKLESGIQLMELSLLPNHSDNEYLNNQIDFLEKQKNDLFHILSNLEGSKQYTETLTNMMGTKAIWIAVVGLLAIVSVNLGFYREVKSTLKQRKLI